jgi:hypothetical protein
MMPHLLHQDRDADLERKPSATDEDLIEDLALPTLVAAMADQDRLVADVCRVLLVSPLQDAAEIRYRQAVLRDCLDHRGVVDELYTLAAQALTAERKVFVGFLTSAESSLNRAVKVLEEFLPALRRLREIADRERVAFGSDGFSCFFRTLQTELDDDFFAQAEAHLQRLTFRHGVLLSARLGTGNRGVDYVLRMRDESQDGVLARLGLVPRPGLVYRVPDRDESGARALSDLRNRGVVLAADALSQAVEHIQAFFRLLQAELAFYRGCLRLHERLAERGLPTCWPDPVDDDLPALNCRGLYDAALALTTGERVVGNDVDADGKALVVVTGANRGGKSTFLRSAGLAQLMMQCGMFAPAEALRAQIHTGVFSHFRREEDAGMDSGKLDDELRRMSDIVDVVQARGLLLCNESFASTNDREGSEIARHVLEPLVAAAVTVIVVTHLFDLAHEWFARGGSDALFLRAERRADGEHTFRIVPGEPEATSYGEDLYRQVFGNEALRTVERVGH